MKRYLLSRLREFLDYMDPVVVDGHVVIVHGPQRVAFRLEDQVTVSLKIENKIDPLESVWVRPPQLVNDTRRVGVVVRIGPRTAIPKWLDGMLYDSGT